MIILFIPPSYLSGTYLIDTDTDSSDGWSVEWSIPSSGNVSISVRATTEDGMIVSSEEINIHVNR